MATTINLTLIRLKSLSGAAALALLLSSAPVHAHDGSLLEVARDYGKSAFSAYQRGEFRTASARFEHAFRARPTSQVALWCARAHAKDGAVESAAAWYQRAMDLPSLRGTNADIQNKARAQAALEVSRLRRAVVRQSTYGTRQAAL